MVFCVLIPVFGFFCIILTQDVFLDIRKDEEFKIRITVFHLNFNLSNKKKKKKKKSISYTRLLLKASSFIEKCEITVTKIAFPKSRSDFSVDSFLSPIKRHALLSFIISFIETKAKRLEVKDGAVSVFSDVQSFCLDITVKSKLFYALKFLFDYIVLSLKEQKRNRRKAYVGKQDGRYNQSLYGRNQELR